MTGTPTTVQCWPSVVVAAVPQGLRTAKPAPSAVAETGVMSPESRADSSAAVRSTWAGAFQVCPPSADRDTHRLVPLASYSIHATIALEPFIAMAGPDFPVAVWVSRETGPHVAPPSTEVRT